MGKQGRSFFLFFSFLLSGTDSEINLWSVLLSINPFTVGIHLPKMKIVSVSLSNTQSFNVSLLLLKLESLHVTLHGLLFQCHFLTCPFSHSIIHPTSTTWKSIEKVSMIESFATYRPDFLRWNIGSCVSYFLIARKKYPGLTS